MLTTKTMSSSLSLPSTSYANSNTRENVSIISIVGMGGLGKTSLAQSTYNDKSVEKYLDKKIWVCISDDFDVFKILKHYGFRCQDYSNTDVLVQKVREHVEGTKYLLVLDDLWNEDPMEWNNLKNVLDFGSVGSKVIVTTRSQIVASVVQGSVPPYNLNVLSEAECWSIIKNKTFLQVEHLMHSLSDERPWLSIRNNKSLETPENHSGGIIPILKLSYDTLPSHLKQCFSYCCLFPKNWKYNRESQIRLWIAEGFVHPSNGRNPNSLEDICNDYFLSLLSSSFFQDIKKDFFFGDIEKFKMHDLVHHLALSVTGSHEVSTSNTSAVETDVSQIQGSYTTKRV